MIIIDYNQMCIASMFAALGAHTNAQVDENMFRHMVLNTIRTLRTKFVHQYGDVVIACDGRHPWRRTIFPYYKIARKEARQKSEVDWAAVHRAMEIVREEIAAEFPYPVVYHNDYEADDIIATLCLYLHKTNFDNQHRHGGGLSFDEAVEEILIISRDKDFIQLQDNPNVKQWDHIGKKFVKVDNPKDYLIDHLITGDVADGIPNILSEDDAIIVKGKRQKKITTKMRQQLFEQLSTEAIDSSLQVNYNRNKSLIDLRMIPEQITNNIIDLFNNQLGKGRSKILNYMMKHKLTMLTEHLPSF